MIAFKKIKELAIKNKFGLKLYCVLFTLTKDKKKIELTWYTESEFIYDTKIYSRGQNIMAKLVSFTLLWWCLDPLPPKSMLDL